MQPTATSNSNPGPLTLWLSALELELKPALALLHVTATLQIAGQPCWQGTLRGHEVRLALGSVGAACADTLAALLERWPDSRVLLVGLAGSLRPSLHIGDVVVASRAATWPTQRDMPGPPLVLGARGCMPVRSRGPRRTSGLGFRVVSGCVVSWHELVQETSLKKHLRQHCNADCVDMETGSVAQVCAARSVPFLAVRGISDRADESLAAIEPADISAALSHATLVALGALS